MVFNKKRVGIGFLFIFIGIILSVFNSILLGVFCKGCSKDFYSSSLFLILFSGILFIVSGSSIIILNKE